MSGPWPSKRLDQVCVVVTDGSHFSPPTTDSGFPYVTVRDLSGDRIDFTNCKFIGEADYNLLVRNGCRPRRGDILFSKDGTVGKVALADSKEDFVVLSSLAIVRPDDRHLTSAFLKYVMLSPAFLDEALGKKRGAAIRRIVLRDLKSIRVPVPPLPEQLRIVSILEEALERIAVARANAERNLLNARSLLESHLQSFFADPGDGWVQKHLEEVALDFGRGRSKHRPRNDPKLYGGKFPFVQTGDVRKSLHLIETYSQTYNDAGLAQSKLWPAGTLCITIAANIAETGILAFDACFPDSVIGLVPDERQVSGPFLEYMLQSYRAHLQTLGKGSAQANINLATFASQPFPFPSLAEQARIVEGLDILRASGRRLESVYERKIAALDELKQTLLHQGFTGELGTTAA